MLCTVSRFPPICGQRRKYNLRVFDKAECKTQGNNAWQEKAAGLEEEGGRRPVKRSEDLTQAGCQRAATIQYNSQIGLGYESDTRPNGAAMKVTPVDSIMDHCDAWWQRPKMVPSTAVNNQLSTVCLSIGLPCNTV